MQSNSNQAKVRKRKGKKNGKGHYFARAEVAKNALGAAQKIAKHALNKKGFEVLCGIGRSSSILRRPSCSSWVALLAVALHG